MQESWSGRAVQIAEAGYAGPLSLPARPETLVIGERVLIEGRVLSGDKNAQFLLGCAAPEDHFADAEALCSTLVNSLRLP